MSDLYDLIAAETDDPELIPEIVPLEARLSLRGPVSRFLPLFERAAAVTPTKERIPGSLYAQLEGVETTDKAIEHVRISATDEMQTISVVADGITVRKPGRALVPAKKLLDILKLASSTLIQIEVFAESAVIRAGSARWTVLVPLASEIQEPPSTENIALHPVERVQFLSALQYVRRALPQVGRPALRQVQVINRRMLSADGNRVHAHYVHSLPKSLVTSIPLAVADEMIRALQGSSEDYFQFGSSDRHLVVQVEQDTLVAQRLLLDFPASVESLVLSATFTNIDEMTVDRVELLEAIKRVRVNSDPDYLTVVLALVPMPKKDSDVPWKLSVRAHDVRGSSAEERIDVQWSGEGKPRELYLNHKSAVDLLASLKADQAVLRLGDDTKTIRTPIVIEHEEFLGILQQMQTPGPR